MTDEDPEFDHPPFGVIQSLAYLVVFLFGAAFWVVVAMFGIQALAYLVARS